MIENYLNYLPQIHPSSFIADSASVIGKVTLDANSSIFHGAVLRGDINEIRIGEGSNIQDLCCLHVTDDLACIVMQHVVVGHHVNLHACTVHDEVLVGIGAIILSGAVIGEGSIIGAGALVLERQQIPPNSLVVGTPAKIIRLVTKEERAYTIHLAKKYQRIAQNYKAQVPSNT